MHTNYANITDTKVDSDYTEPMTAEFHDIVDVTPVEDDVAVEQIEDKTQMGKVICGRLYLRSEPSSDSESITILNKDEELMIVSEDDPEWYSVYTAAGQEGFCKKEFIQVD